MYYIDLKYLKLLPLEQLTQKSSGKWNMRCPVCGDSKKNPNLKRGWAINYKNNMFIKCFNCDYSSSFSKFLKLYYPTYYPDYIKEKFQSKDLFKKESKNNSVDIFATEYDNLNLQQLKDLPDNHKSVSYCIQRAILVNNMKHFYYTDEFGYWVNQNINGKLFSNEKIPDPRIVIPFYNRYKKIFAVQGRAINNQKPKYLTVKTVESEDKLYGLNTINFNKPIYVVEGPIDSLFLDNCVALAGTLSNIQSLLKYTHKENITIVPDNDFRNKQTRKITEDSLKEGYKTVIWPKDINFKDINDGVIKGHTKKDISDIIEQNTYSGLMGLSKFKLKGI